MASDRSAVSKHTDSFYSKSYIPILTRRENVVDSHTKRCFKDTCERDLGDVYKWTDEKYIQTNTWELITCKYNENFACGRSEIKRSTHNPSLGDRITNKCYTLFYNYRSCRSVISDFHQYQLRYRRSSFVTNAYARPAHRSYAYSKNNQPLSKRLTSYITERKQSIINKHLIYITQ